MGHCLGAYEFFGNFGQLDMLAVIDVVVEADVNDVEIKFGKFFDKFLGKSRLSSSWQPDLQHKTHTGLFTGSHFEVFFLTIPTKERNVSENGENYNKRHICQSSYLKIISAIRTKLSPIHSILQVEIVATLDTGT